AQQSDRMGHERHRNARLRGRRPARGAREPVPSHPVGGGAALRRVRRLGRGCVAAGHDRGCDHRVDRRRPRPLRHRRRHRAGAAEGADLALREVAAPLGEGRRAGRALVRPSGRRRRAARAVRASHPVVGLGAGRLPSHAVARLPALYRHRQPDLEHRSHRRRVPAARAVGGDRAGDERPPVHRRPRGAAGRRMVRLDPVPLALGPAALPIRAGRRAGGSSRL
ncbi:MAG: hypothetical protein AVDCRST_MAG50-2070, partial [uncultured Acidimicrobiales bacterium]